MKRLIALSALVVAPVAMADFFEEGFFEDGFFEDGFFEENEPTFPVPSVIGEADSAAADAILEGDGFDLGAVTARCSDEAEDEVVGQDPAPGALAELGTLVNVLVSNGEECASGRPGVSIKGLSIGI